MISEHAVEVIQSHQPLGLLMAETGFPWKRGKLTLTRRDVGP